MDRQLPSEITTRHAQLQQLGYHVIIRHTGENLKELGEIFSERKTTENQDSSCKHRYIARYFCIFKNGKKITEIQPKRMSGKIYILAWRAPAKKT